MPRLTVDEAKRLADEWRPRFADPAAFEVSWSRYMDSSTVYDRGRLEQWLTEDLAKDQVKHAGIVKEPLLPVRQNLVLGDCDVCRGKFFVRHDVDIDHPDFGKVFPCPRAEADADLMTQPAPHATTRCSAMSKQTGQPCGARVGHGFTVCYWHGARAPQVRATAEERMRALVHPAVTALQQLIAENDLAAAKYVLDYAGFKATEKVQQDGKVTLEIELVKRPLELDQPDA